MFFATLLSTILHIGAACLDVEIADTDMKRARGLMHRDSLGENEGMLFVFDKSEIVHFWMKETKIPLSIGFFDEQKRLTQISHMEPPKADSSRLKDYPSEKATRYALEVPQHWFERHKITPGMKFTLQDLPQSIK